MTKKIISCIISIFKFIITLVIMAIIGVILVQRFSDNNMSLAGYRIFTVITESMVPKYEVGDVLLVKETDINEINVGDDVTYLGEKGSFADKIVTHQVVSIEKGESGELEITTKGIANDTEDPVISESQIYGVVIRKLEVITYLNGIINNMYGMYFLIIIPLAIIMFTEFKAFREDDKKIKEEYEDDDEDDEDDEDSNKKVDKKAKKRKEKRAKRRKRYG